MSYQNRNKKNAPLAGKPPFATDLPDEYYEQSEPRPRPRKQPQKQPDDTRDSTYQAWDEYLKVGNDNDNRASGVGGIGMGLMSGDLDDSDDDLPPVQKQPAKAANPPSKNIDKPRHPQQPQQQRQQQQPITRPPPAASPVHARQQGNYEKHQGLAQPHPRQANAVRRPAAAALQVSVTQPVMPIPRAPITFVQNPPSPSPSPNLNPHPLNAPSTPITPAFARPGFQGERKVEFTQDAILRGNSEETLLPRNTRKGDEFWRRFSFVAKDEAQKKYQQSPWLKRTQGGANRMSRLVWCISVFILVAMGGGIGFGWYMTHNKPAAPPVAVGGSENQTQISSAPPSSSTQNNTSRTLIAPPAVETKRALANDVVAREPNDNAMTAGGVVVRDVHMMKTNHYTMMNSETRMKQRHKKRKLIEDLD